MGVITLSILSGSQNNVLDVLIPLEVQRENSQIDAMQDLVQKQFNN
jgi:hypothetical protein